MANGDLLGNAVPRICDAEGYVVISCWMRELSLSSLLVYGYTIPSLCMS